MIRNFSAEKVCSYHLFIVTGNRARRSHIFPLTRSWGRKLRDIDAFSWNRYFFTIHLWFVDALSKHQCGTCLGRMVLIHFQYFFYIADLAFDVFMHPFPLYEWKEITFQPWEEMPLTPRLQIRQRTREGADLSLSGHDGMTAGQTYGVVHCAGGFLRHGGWRGRRQAISSFELL